MLRTGPLLLFCLVTAVATPACKDKAPPMLKEPAAKPKPAPTPLTAAAYLGRARQAADKDTSLAMAWLRRFYESPGAASRWQRLQAWGLLAELGRDGRGATVLRKGGGPVSALAFSPSGELLAVGDDKGAVTLYRTRSLKQFGKLAPAPSSDSAPEPVSAMIFSPDSATLAAAGQSGRITLWGLSAQGPRPREVRHGAKVEALVFSGDSQLLWINGGGLDRVVTVDNPAIPDAGLPTWPVGEAMKPAPLPWRLTANPGGSVTLEAEAGKTAPKRTLTLRGHGQAVKQVAFTLDGGRAATACGAGEIRLWDLTMARQLVRWTDLAGGKARASRLTQDGQRVLLLGPRGKLCVHRTDGSSRRCLPLKRYSGSLTQMGLTRDGKQLVIRSGSTARFWTLQSGKSRAARLEPDEVVALSPDGGHMTSSTFDGELVLRSTASGEELNRSSTRHKGNRVQDVYGITYSPAGRRLATVRSDGSVQLWKAAALTPSGKLMMAGIQKPDMPVFTPDEAQMVVGERNGRVAFWDASKGELIRRTPKAHDGEISVVAFAAMSPMMATAGKEGQIKLWDLPTRKPKGPVLGIPGGVCHDLAFSPGDRHLVCAGASGLVTIWDLEAGGVEAMKERLEQATNIHVDDAGKVTVK